MESTHLELNPRLHNEMPFPATVRENVQRMNSRGANLIQRVSEESFLVRNPEMTQDVQARSQDFSKGGYMDV